MTTSKIVTLILPEDKENNTKLNPYREDQLCNIDTTGLPTEGVSRPRLSKIRTNLSDVVARKDAGFFRRRASIAAVNRPPSITAQHQATQVTRWHCAIPKMCKRLMLLVQTVRHCKHRQLARHGWCSEGLCKPAGSGFRWCHLACCWPMSTPTPVNCASR